MGPFDPTPNLPKAPGAKGYTCKTPSQGLPIAAVDNFIGFLQGHAADSVTCVYTGSTCKQLTSWQQEELTVTFSFCGMGLANRPAIRNCVDLIPALHELQGNCTTNQWAIDGGQASVPTPAGWFPPAPSMGTIGQDPYTAPAMWIPVSQYISVDRG